ALERVADRRALASTTCSMATGCTGDQQQLQGHALERVADRRALIDGKKHGRGNCPAFKAYGQSREYKDAAALRL
ncbi:hypothetical protein ACSZOM_21405, partial [Aeromonas hydrophila]